MITPCNSPRARRPIVPESKKSGVTATGGFPDTVGVRKKGKPKKTVRAPRRVRRATGDSAGQPEGRVRRHASTSARVKTLGEENKESVCRHLWNAKEFTPLVTLYRAESKKHEDQAGRRRRNNKSCPPFRAS